MLIEHLFEVAILMLFIGMISDVTIYVVLNFSEIEGSSTLGYIWCFLKPICHYAGHVKIQPTYCIIFSFYSKLTECSYLQII